MAADIACRSSSVTPRSLVCWHSSIPSASTPFHTKHVARKCTLTGKAWLSLKPTQFKEKRMKFRPLHDRVVIRRIKEDSQTKGGIIIPETAREKPMQGEVVAVGPGRRDEAGKLVPIDVKAGEIILFGKWSGTEVKIDGEELLIMQEGDIMGVIIAPAVAKAA
jgi:chaperonin GroES